MKKKTLPELVAVAVIVATLIFAGCIENGYVDVDQTREYADPITENILIGINENNYTRYSEPFYQAESEYSFNGTRNMIKSEMGDYISKEFWKAESRDKYIIVLYKARFTKETEDVIVKVAFRDIGSGRMHVFALWLESPKVIMCLSPRMMTTIAKGWDNNTSQLWNSTWRNF